MKHSITRELDQASAWAVVMAGGSGTRVQNLTRKIEGDQKPQQFCRILGGRSLLGEPRRLLVMRDAASGWADLGNPDRVVNTLVQNQIESEWLLKMRGPYLPGPTINSRRPRRRRGGMIAFSCG